MDISGLELSLQNIVKNIEPLEMSGTILCMVRSTSLKNKTITVEMRTTKGVATLQTKEHIVKKLKFETGRVFRMKVKNGALESYYDERSGRVA